MADQQAAVQPASAAAPAEIRALPPSPTRLDALDGWRALGALMVVASHLQAGGVTSDATLRSVAYGHLGVDYFFGISGFVIARGLLAGGSGATLAGFYIRRFFRILPPLVLYVLVIMGLALSGLVPSQAMHVVRALTFTCNLSDADCGGWLGAHTWSLSVEEQFYLVIPLALALVRPRWLLLAAMVAVGPLTLALMVLHKAAATEFVGNFTFIALGVACALYEGQVSRLAARIPAWSVPTTLLMSLAITYLPAGRITSVLTCLALPAIVLFALMVSAFRQERWLQSLLGKGPLKEIGAFSYGLYLWQQLATGAWQGDNLWQHLLAVAAILVLTWALFRWMEKPLIQLGHRLARKVGEVTDRAHSAESYVPSRFPKT